MDAGMRDVIEDEISLVDMLQKLLSGWRWVVGWGLVGGAIAGAALLTMPSLWEATAIIQVAQQQLKPGQSQAGQAGQAGRGFEYS